MAFQQKHVTRKVHVPEVVCHQGRFMYSNLPSPHVVNGLEGWFSSIVKGITNVVTAPIRVVKKVAKGDIKGAFGAAMVPWAKSDKTIGRVMRRAGGVVTGAVTGFATGGLVGAVAGGVTGGLSAGKGTRGIIGYGKIAATSAVVGATAAAVTGAAAQTGFSTGILSQSTAQSAILASGKSGLIGMGVTAGAPVGASIGVFAPTLAAAGSYIGAKTVGAVTTLTSAMGTLKPPALPAATADQTAEAAYDASGYSDYLSRIRYPRSGGSSDYAPLYGSGGSEVYYAAGGGGGGAVSYGEEYSEGATPAPEEPASMFSSIEPKTWMILGGVAIVAISIMNSKPPKRRA